MRIRHNAKQPKLLFVDERAVDGALLGKRYRHPTGGILIEYAYTLTGEAGRKLYCGPAQMPSGAQGEWCWFADELEFVDEQDLESGRAGDC